MAKKIDPFSHVADSDHIEFFGGLELQGLEVNGVPLKFIIFITFGGGDRGRRD